jgi:predicted O-linked N-acetylglucosamine transferase (SPINDLY family)
MMVVLNANSRDMPLSEATVFFQQGELLAAARICRAILARDPSQAQALHLLGLVNLRLGHVARAVECLRQSATLAPSIAELHNSLGAAFAIAGQHAEAAHEFKRATQLRPDYVMGHLNLGLTLQACGELAAAEDALRHAINLSCDNAEAHAALAGVLERRGKLAASLRARRSAMRLGADVAEMLRCCAVTLGDAGRIEGMIRCLNRAVAVRPTDPGLHSALLYAMHYSSRSSSRQVAEAHREWSLRHEQPLQNRAVRHTNDRWPSRLLRVGYLSADFRGSSVAVFLEPLIECHDRRSFQIACYSDVRQPDALTRRFQDDSDLWRDTCGIDDDSLAALIRRDAIDILVDPTGHMAGTRMGVFARKPAPLQVAFPGYPGSTGLNCMDAIISDRFQSPLNFSPQDSTTEQLLRLDSSPRCYRVQGDEPDVGPLPARSRGYVTFGSFNRPLKVGCEVIKVWAAILHQVPRARLMMHVGRGGVNATHRLRRLFATFGVWSDRIGFVGQASRQVYFDLFNRVDLALDTFPYNGCTTTCDALWMGVPTLSLVGHSYVSRVGLSILSQLNLAGLAVESKQAYVDTAVRLATDVPLLQDLRHNLRRMMRSSPLCDAKGMVASFEDALRWLWVQWCERTRAEAHSVASPPR